jgi:O-acetyl-ADP-ribose deacetylase (regulator of RNase III)
VITTGGNLKAKFVIHTVGPVWHGGKADEAELLASAYRESLKLAAGHGLESVAFPSISTGVYGYPMGEAASVAIRAVIRFLTEEDTSIRRVVFVLFSRNAYESYASALDSAVPHG